LVVAFASTVPTFKLASISAIAMLRYPVGHLISGPLFHRTNHGKSMRELMAGVSNGAARVYAVRGVRPSDR
jgi:hypothetical protein